MYITYVFQRSSLSSVLHFSRVPSAIFWQPVGFPTFLMHPVPFHCSFPSKAPHTLAPFSLFSLLLYFLTHP